MAQSFGHLTLDFGSGHDLTVHGFKPRTVLGAGSAEPAWDSLSLSLFLSAPPPLVCLSLSLSLSKQINNFKIFKNILIF